MKKSINLRNRHTTEETFHDKWAKEINLHELLVRESFESVTAVENAYALETFGDLMGKTLLDLGCGAGETSVYFALKGATVTAVDISAEMLSVAKRLSDLHRVAIKTVKSVAESLEFPDNTFDYVFGNGVLHHVRIEDAVREVKRVLKPRGRAIFIEPLAYNPLIHVYRMLAKDVRTPTERPVRFQDLTTMKRYFNRTRHREFWLFSLLIFFLFLLEGVHPSKERYWKKVIVDGAKYKKSFTFLKRIDDFVLRVFPCLGRYCWNTVIVLEK